MRISVRRWAASHFALLLVAALLVPSAAPAQGTDTAWLGVFTQELSPDLEEALDHRGDAVLVTRVVSGSPAERAGLRKGDLIVRVESDRIASPAELARVVQRRSAGDEVEIQIMRNGERRTLTATLGSRSDEGEETKRRVDRFESPREDSGERRSTREFRIQIPDPPEAPEAPDAPVAPLLNRARLGVRIETLSSDLAEYFDVRDGRGVLVVDVVEDSPAKRIGIKPGDVIVSIDDRDVADTEDVIRAIGESKGQIAVTVVRHGSRRTFEVELGQAPESMFRLDRRPGVRSWRFDGNSWRRPGASAPDARSREDMERELRELREELKELKEDLKQLRDR